MTKVTVAGPYDLSLVEGSITTPDDVERIKQVRSASRRLVTIGACATAGGIQGLRNFAASGEYACAVYAHPEYIATLDTSTPISAHVAVDYELHGCPIDKQQLLEVITAQLAGRRPVIPGHSVCQECKGRGTVCLLVSRASPCLGPVTRAGCGALCPGVDRGCFGCFGPADTANTAALPASFVGEGMTRVDISRLFRTFNANAPAFLAESWPKVGRRLTHGGAASRGDHDARMAVSARSASGAGWKARAPSDRNPQRCRRYGQPSTSSNRRAIFEALLRGRRHTEAPDITARICGICPVAYEMSACAAIEDACGVMVDTRIESLRRLLYCGEWIQSHALHVYLLHAPDFLGCQDALELAELDRTAVERGLQLKRIGNLLMEAVGGRAVHPVNVKVGGFYRAPAVASLQALAEPLQGARLALETVSWVAASSSPTSKATIVSSPFGTRTATPSTPDESSRPTGWT